MVLVLMTSKEIVSVVRKCKTKKTGIVLYVYMYTCIHKRKSLSQKKSQSITVFQERGGQELKRIYRTGEARHRVSVETLRAREHRKGTTILTKGVVGGSVVVS